MSSLVRSERAHAGFASTMDHRTIVVGKVRGAGNSEAGQVFGEHGVYDARFGQSRAESFVDFFTLRARLIRKMSASYERRPMLGKMMNALGPLGAQQQGHAAHADQAAASNPGRIAPSID